VTLLITRSPDTSFPSDHATLAFAVGVMVWRFNRRLGLVLLLFGVLTAFARVFVGVHYPSDVLGGAVLGSVVSLLIAVASDREAPCAFLNGLLATLARWHLATAPAPPGQSA
jgi:undecaprenyl-diphosphatase